MSTNSITRRHFIRATGAGVSALALSNGIKCAPKQRRRPNILFAIADDWSWPHASIAGEPVVQTPNFDRIAGEGVLFNNAFVSAPSCTPSRAAILTGQYHWRLQESGNLWSTLQSSYPIYPDLLEAYGYHVGFTRKGWGPGLIEPGGRTRNPAGNSYKDFAEFLAARPEGAPFCFWFGSHDPHRSYEWESGVHSGMDAAQVRVPACLPDHEIVRKDLCDYFYEVQRFDREVGDLMAALEQIGELDHTLIVVTGDNGLPFPRCKSNLYDTGTHAPLAVRWGRHISSGRVVDDFVSLTDLAPTFLEIAGLAPTPDMTGKSLMPLLTSAKTGQIEASRDHVLVGKERHAWVRRNGLGYPMRAIRTRDFLYIYNFEPDRWPAGDPEPGENNNPKGSYGDVDGSPTKSFMLEHRNDPAMQGLFELAFGKRPQEELYDLRQDPEQLMNIAGKAGYEAIQRQLRDQLFAELKETLDPRVLGGGEQFDKYPYYGGGATKVPR